jgi:UDP-2,4-diacetamido-2,4,6-trideoxy-beta-L-altropyranose hydrolase
MKVVLRTDASIQMGTGHVMRCLTLADALAAKGAQCTFICREHTGNLIEHIRSKGHAVHSLPMGTGVDADLAHSAWLGATQAQDAQACAPLLATLQPDWLVVDHYALDASWESALAKHCGQTMVIDDLADRPHDCNLLLDQTFGRQADDYRPLVPDHCTLLCGSSYALLRPEFAALRPYSLQRRSQPLLKHLLITLGGVDKDNITAQVLNALRASPLPADCTMTVVMGSTAPWLAEVQQQAQNIPWPTTVRVGVSNMAQLMADSDLAIGAAGATSWERCCLGLPGILVVLAANQTTIATALTNVGAAVHLEISDLPRLLAHIPAMRGDQAALSSMSYAASQICKGEGVTLVSSQIMKVHNEDHIASQRS